MDKRKILLLKYLLNNCSEGYKVLETKKVLSSLKKYKSDYKLFETDIEYLRQMNYVDLKYIDHENLCLCIKDNSRIMQENIKIERCNRRQLVLSLLLSVFVSGIMSFVGAFLAILLTR